MTNDERDANLKLLWDDFPDEMVGKLPRKGPDGRTVYLPYIGHAHVTKRLLMADPEWNWEPLAYDSSGLPLFERVSSGRAIGLWIKLTVCGVTRLGYGSVAPTVFDAEKQLIGDALRNAAMRFGVALTLWAKTELESEIGHSEKPPAKATPKAPPTEAKVAAKAPPTADPVKTPAKITRDEALDIRAQLKAAGLTDEPFCKVFEVEAVEDLPASRYAEAVQRIKARAEKAAANAPARGAKPATPRRNQNPEVVRQRAIELINKTLQPLNDDELGLKVLQGFIDKVQPEGGSAYYSEIGYDVLGVQDSNDVVKIADLIRDAIDQPEAAEAHA